MQTATKRDVVTQYLASLGHAPQPARFLDTAFVIGWRVILPEFELVYRLEQQQLVICDFLAKGEGKDGARAVMAFIQLIHNLERALPQLLEVRGMLMDSPYPQVNQLRQRLSRALESQGASWKETHGERWLIYPTGIRKPALTSA
ncbi:hypothetical protein QRZ34_28625 [Klebsiella michiganensis]|uniref:hypothetical protein n=1 Tax=Klebsiella michiganensis TaxID=1134687 RepID=UPI0025701059|nr:hypothetical protein [Klebsiella michiganensis]MDL4454958.1 hypothetical protein [Klebsiella michiganensis]